MHEGNEARALALQGHDGARPICPAMGDQQIQNGFTRCQRIPQGAAATPKPVAGSRLMRELLSLLPGGLGALAALPLGLQRRQQRCHQVMRQGYQGQKRPTHQKGQSGRVMGQEMPGIGMLHAINAGGRSTPCAGNQSRNIEQNAQAPALGFAGNPAPKARERPEC